ncbi:MAG: cryptochrome/photolyase family protein [Pseudomonadales bacterium]
MTRTPLNYLLLCGDQLFPLAHLQRDFAAQQNLQIVMVEDAALCERRPYHQQKLTLVLAAMRSHARALEDSGYQVHYRNLSQQQSLAETLTELPGLAGQTLLGYQPHSRGQRRWIEQACSQAGCAWQPAPSPYFLTDSDTFTALAGARLPLQMGRFYKAQRQRLEVLLTADGAPQGGRWSFDEDNRRKFPKRQTAPELPAAKHTADSRAIVTATATEIAERYPDSMGDAHALWLPTDRAGALAWLQCFLHERLVGFGTYEDAISQRSWSLFHSTLSPLINVGLLPPAEVLQAVLDFADKHAVPDNDLEGFVRQLIGWREFVGGVYQQHGAAMRSSNSRNQTRRMLPSWHQGRLDIPPFDDAIATLKSSGWNHHIDRLMVIANLMNLAMIEPDEVFEFFMTYYIDAYDWVMVPNVYGMGLNSDDNTFATKPYICGSNYWLKMSDYSKGPWCDVVDGLYWRFVDRHREALASNPRTAMMPRNLDRLRGERKQTIFAAAAAFLEQHTASP